MPRRLARCEPRGYPRTAPGSRSVPPRTAKTHIRRRRDRGRAAFRPAPQPKRIADEPVAQFSGCCSAAQAVADVWLQAMTSHGAGAARIFSACRPVQSDRLLGRRLPEHLHRNPCRAQGPGQQALAAHKCRSKRRPGQHAYRSASETDGQQAAAATAVAVARRRPRPARLRCRPTQERGRQATLEQQHPCSDTARTAGTDRPRAATSARSAR